MAENKIRLPSGQGGLTRYSDEYSSKVQITPITVVIIILVVIVLTAVLYSLGPSWLS